jgi:hypothetical protein
MELPHSGGNVKRYGTVENNLAVPEEIKHGYHMTQKLHSQVHAQENENMFTQEVVCECL